MVDTLFRGSLVKTLTGADFDDKTPWTLRNENRCCFILFYAEWCGHCQTLKPDYVKFADVAQFIQVYAVDSDEQATLMKRLQQKESPVHIQGFPTIWMYSDGKPMEEYTGKRTTPALLTAAQKFCHEKCTCAK